MSHKLLKKLARKLMTQSEIKKKTPIFQSAGWEKRKKSIQKRGDRKKRIAKERAIKRRELAKNNKDKK